MKTILSLLLATLSINAQVGIGTTTPTETLDVNGTTKTKGIILSTNPNVGYVLTSDVNGRGTWQQPNSSVGNIVVGNISLNGVNIPFNTGGFVQTGSSITLPKGRYVVNVTMLLAPREQLTTNNNESMWLKSSFSDSAGINPNTSVDIAGATLMSGGIAPSSYYGTINGSVIINNTSGFPKTYYYVAGRCVNSRSSLSLSNFSSTSHSENIIIANKIN